MEKDNLLEAEKLLNAKNVSEIESLKSEIDELKALIKSLENSLEKMTAERDEAHRLKQLSEEATFLAEKKLEEATLEKLEERKKAIRDMSYTMQQLEAERILKEEKQRKQKVTWHCCSTISGDVPIISQRQFG